MKDVFFNEDLAIGTYRHAIATTIPEMTKVAWSKKRDEILKVIPACEAGRRFVFNLHREQYEKEFGADYEKPHGFARFLAFDLPADPEDRPVPHAQLLGADARGRTSVPREFRDTREHFRQSLDALRAGRLHLVNTDFDTGQADDTRRILACRRHVRRTAREARRSQVRRRHEAAAGESRGFLWRPRRSAAKDP